MNNLLKIYKPIDENLLVITNPMYKTTREKMNILFNNEPLSGTYSFNIINENKISINVQGINIKSGVYLKLESTTEGVGYYYVYEVRYNNNIKTHATLFLERDPFYDIPLYLIRGDIASTSLKRFTYAGSEITPHVFDYSNNILKPYVENIVIEGVKNEINKGMWVIEDGSIKVKWNDSDEILSDNIIRKPKYKITQENTGNYSNLYIGEGSDSNIINNIFKWNQRDLNGETVVFKILSHPKRDFAEIWGCWIDSQSEEIKLYISKFLLRIDLLPREFHGDEALSFIRYIKVKYNIDLTLEDVNEGVWSKRLYQPINNDNIYDVIPNIDIHPLISYGEYLDNGGTPDQGNMNIFKLLKFKKINNDLKLTYPINIKKDIVYKYNPILHINPSFTSYTINSSVVSHLLKNQYSIKGNKLDVLYEYIIKPEASFSKVIYSNEIDLKEVNDNDVIIKNKANDYLLQNRNQLKLQQTEDIFNGVTGALSTGFSSLWGLRGLGVSKHFNHFTNVKGDEYYLDNLTYSYSKLTNDSIKQTYTQQIGNGIISTLSSVINPILNTFRRKAMIEDLKNQHIYRPKTVNNEEVYGDKWYITKNTISDTQFKFYNNFFNRFGWGVNAYLNGLDINEIRDEYDFIKLTNIEEIYTLDTISFQTLKNMFSIGIYILPNPEGKYQIDFDEPWSE